MNQTSSTLSRVRVRVPATTANLGPGFDCLGMALRLHNEVEIALEGEKELTVEVGGRAATDHIPLDGRNLVWRAAARVFELAGRAPERVTLRLDISAPLARGLGSSASAIVGGMTAANEVLGRPLSADDLLREMVAMEGHPDNVVPCARGGLTASLSFGDGRVLYLKHAPHPSVRCVVFIPDYELSTAKARQAIPKSLPMKDAVFNLGRVPFVLAKLVAGDFQDLGSVMDDRLHQPYRKPLIRSYDLLASQAEQAGAAAVCISGAGPTILAVCSGEKAGHVAEAMREVTQAADLPGEVAVLETDLDGAVVLAADE